MDYNDFKVFTPVLWWFATKFAPLACVFRCALCKQGRYTRKKVDTPESWHSVCLIFGRAVFHYSKNVQLVHRQGEMG